MTVEILLGDRPPFSVPMLAERWGCSEGLVRKLIRNGRRFIANFRPLSIASPAQNGGSIR